MGSQCFPRKERNYVTVEQANITEQLQSNFHPEADMRRHKETDMRRHKETDRQTWGDMRRQTDMRRDEETWGDRHEETDMRRHTWGDTRRQTWWDNGTTRQGKLIGYDLHQHWREKWSASLKSMLIVLKANSGYQIIYRMKERKRHRYTERKSEKERNSEWETGTDEYIGLHPIYRLHNRTYHSSSSTHVPPQMLTGLLCAYCSNHL